MRFDDRVTGNLKTYAPNAKKIHMEIDRSEVNKNVKVDLALIGNVRDSLDQLLPHVEACYHADWIETINEMKQETELHEIQNLPDNGHLYAAHVINDLWRYAGDNALVVTDVGQHQMWAANISNAKIPIP